MVKIDVNLSDELHYRIRRIQIDLEMQGEKKQLKDLYAELMNIGAIQFRSQSMDKPDKDH
ncbi:MAG: hypothetical protein EOO39_40480 [Cytophagaceae bacterium]|nr:MAG: hypothetical protein EOO39_40480 [Cytophagaceae bacterium]